jgi:dynein heavy chain
VGAHEPPVEKLRKQIKDAINQALIPMKAYAREYERHLELMNLDINKYIAYEIFYLSYLKIMRS